MFKYIKMANSLFQIVIIFYNITVFNSIFNQINAVLVIVYKNLTDPKIYLHLLHFFQEIVFLDSCFTHIQYNLDKKATATMKAVSSPIPLWYVQASCFSSTLVFLTLV